jgi:hypothetical protein
LQELPPQQILLGLMCGSLHLDIPEWCEPEWRYLLEACMEPNPNNRPTMRELARQLEAIRDQQLQHEQEIQELHAQKQQQLQQEQQEQQEQQAQQQEQALQAQQRDQQEQQAEAVAAGPCSSHAAATEHCLPASLQGLQEQQQQQQHFSLPSPVAQQSPQQPHSQQYVHHSPVRPHPLRQLSAGGGLPQVGPEQNGSEQAYGAVCEHYWPQQ